MHPNLGADTAIPDFKPHQRANQSRGVQIRLEVFAMKRRKRPDASEVAHFLMVSWANISHYVCVDFDLASAAKHSQGRLGQ